MCHCILLFLGSVFFLVQVVLFCSVLFAEVINDSKCSDVVLMTLGLRAGLRIKSYLKFYYASFNDSMGCAFFAIKL